MHNSRKQFPMQKLENKTLGTCLCRQEIQNNRLVRTKLKEFLTMHEEMKMKKLREKSINDPR